MSAACGLVGREMSETTKTMPSIGDVIIFKDGLAKSTDGMRIGRVTDTSATNFRAYYMKADDTETYKSFELDSDKWMPMAANHKVMSIDTKVWGAFTSAHHFEATITYDDNTTEDVAFNKIKPFDTFGDEVEDGEIIEADPGNEADQIEADCDEADDGADDDAADDSDSAKRQKTVQVRRSNPSSPSSPPSPPHLHTFPPPRHSNLASPPSPPSPPHFHLPAARPV